MKKENYIGLAVVALILTAGISTAFADVETRGERKGFSEEHRAHMTEIFENGTYSDWIAEVNQKFEERTNLREGRHAEMMTKMTEQNWEQMKEAHRLMQAGDYEGVRAIKESLGFEQGFGPRGEGLKDGSYREMREGKKFNQ